MTALIQGGFSGSRINSLSAKTQSFPGCKTPRFLKECPGGGAGGRGVGTVEEQRKSLGYFLIPLHTCSSFLLNIGMPRLKTTFPSLPCSWVPSQWDVAISRFCPRREGACPCAN